MSFVFLIGLIASVSAGHVSCGDVITVDTTLDEDLSCTGYAGLSFGVNDVTLDGAGHSISGDGTPGAGAIVISSGKHGVTVKNIIAKNYNRGYIITGGASNNTLLNNTFINNFYAGSMYSSNYNIVSGNSFIGNTYLDAFYGGSSYNLFTDNLYVNGDSIALYY